MVAPCPVSFPFPLAGGPPKDTGGFNAPTGTLMPPRCAFPLGNDPRRACNDDQLLIRDGTKEYVECNGQHKWDFAKYEGICKHFVLGCCQKQEDCSFIHPRFWVGSDGKRTVYGAWSTKSHKSVCRQVAPGKHVMAWCYGYNVQQPTYCVRAPWFEHYRTGKQADVWNYPCFESDWVVAFRRAANDRSTYLQWLHDGICRLDVTRNISPQQFKPAVKTYIRESEEPRPSSLFPGSDNFSVEIRHQFEKTFNHECDRMRRILDKWNAAPLELRTKSPQCRDPYDELRATIQDFESEAQTIIDDTIQALKDSISSPLSKHISTQTTSSASNTQELEGLPPAHSHELATEK